MNATDTMKEEHRLILRVLQCLSASADQAEKEPGLDVESIQKMLEFFRGFADRCHHAKEEAHFFPLARQRGVGCPPASIDSLIAEHQEDRDHIRVMDENLSEAGSGDREAKVDISDKIERPFILIGRS